MILVSPRPGRRPGMTAVLLLSLAASARAEPDDRIAAEASSHFEAGIALVKRNNHLAALAEFEKAYALAPHWEFLYNIGVTQRTLFRYGAAIKTLERYLAEGGAQVPDDRRKRVDTELSDLRKLVGEVGVTVDGVPARIEVDGGYEGDSPLAAPLLVAPGSHVIRATRTGEVADQRTISVVSGERVDVKLEPHPQPLLPRTARLTILTRPGNAQIRVDDGAAKPAPWIGEVDAGGHRILAELSGYRAESSEIRVDAGQQRTLTLDLGPLPAHKPFYRRPVFWVLVAVGVAATVGSTILLTRPEGSDVVLHWP